MDHAFEKLEAPGARLPFPHQSHVRGVLGLRELRPRGGRSRWRAFFRRFGQAMVIGAIGPEAKIDRGGFARAVATAQVRLEQVEADGAGVANER